MLVDSFQKTESEEKGEKEEKGKKKEKEKRREGRERGEIDKGTIENLSYFFNSNSNSNLYSPDSCGNEGEKAAPLSKNKRACVRCVV